MGRATSDHHVMVDTLVDKLYRDLGIEPADVFRTRKILRMVCEGMPR